MLESGTVCKHLIGYTRAPRIGLNLASPENFAPRDIQGTIDHARTRTPAMRSAHCDGITLCARGIAVFPITRFPIYGGREKLHDNFAMLLKDWVCTALNSARSHLHSFPAASASERQQDSINVDCAHQGAIGRAFDGDSFLRQHQSGSHTGWTNVNSTRFKGCEATCYVGYEVSTTYLMYSSLTYVKAQLALTSKTIS